MTRRSVTRPEVRVGGFWLSSIAPQGWGDLKHSTRLNGSWEASFQLPKGEGTWRHPALTYGSPVEIMLGPVCVWSGTLDEPDWDSGEFVALGACRDGETAVALNAAGETSTAPNTVIDQAIVRGALSWTRVGDFGTTAVGEVDSSGGVVTLQSVLDAWAQENESEWHVDTKRNLIIRPTSEENVDWLVMPGSGVLGSAAEERVDRIFVRYISSTTGRRATVSYPATTPVGGIEKPMDITDRGPMTTAKAQSVAESEWAKLQGRSGWTNGLTLSRGQVTTTGGIEADLALIKAGDTKRLLGVPDPRGLNHNLDVVIGDTDYDWATDEAQVNPVGMAARDTESVLEQVGNLAVEAKAGGTVDLSGLIRAGAVAIDPTAAATFTAQAVVFTTPMLVTPRVTTQVLATNGEAEAYVSDVAKTGFTINFRRDTDTTTVVSWTAIAVGLE